MKRRALLKFGLASGALSMLPSVARAAARLPNLGRVVVVGGGFAGATVAKYLRMWSQGGIEVIVVEPSAQFVSCPVSNLVLGGSKQINDMVFGYELLQRNHGMQWVTDSVTAIDHAASRIRMTRGELQYDRLVIAPGVDFFYDQLPGLTSLEAQRQVPHAWKAGLQTVQLRQQLQAMRDGEVFLISIPKMPYRCPPGPYERACQVAFYFKQHKPRSKVIILDANPDVTSKKALFTKVWAEMYPGMVDYRPNSSVVEVDIASRTVKTEFDSITAGVLNIIPPQRAGKPAQMAELLNVDNRWCAVDFLDYQSTAARGIHVIGDAVSAGLPKSAHMATSHAKVCASAIVAQLSGQQLDPAPVFANTCYSYASDVSAMHVANVYRYDATKKVMLPAEGGGISEAPSVLEGRYAQAWARNIWSDVLT